MDLWIKIVDLISSLIETRTIQEAIKQEAKKLVPASAGEKPLYGYSQAPEFLLPGQVYGSNFPPHAPQGCFVMPDGFVTPIRSGGGYFADLWASTST